jgi:hypothetical protein
MSYGARRQPIPALLRCRLVGRKLPDPCKSGQTGRIIDSALKFDPVILDKAM